MLQNLLQECSVLCKTSLSLRCLLDEVFARFASVFRAFVCKRASCLSRPCSIIFILPVHARYVFSCALQRIPLLPCHWLHVNGFVNWDLFPLAYLRHTKFNVTLFKDGLNTSIVWRSPNQRILAFYYRYSQTEIEETLNAVSAGPRYLSRVVDAADQLLSTIKPATSS